MNTAFATDPVIVNLYAQTQWMSLSCVSQRINYLARFLCEKPYITTPQGEGLDALIDPAPLYRLDGFDCVTYVNNILALALSHDIPSFQKNYLRLNYYYSNPSFENRFHFMSVDWNPQNQKNKIVADVTKNIFNKSGQMIADFAEGDIDRPAWFLKKGVMCVSADHIKKEWVSLPYLPLHLLFDQNKTPDDFLFQQIPNVSVIEIVRPNWSLKEKIGTNLHVSHVGFSLRDANGVLWFYHA